MHDIILVYLSDPSYSEEAAEKKIIFVFKILTFVFALPLYDNESYLYNNNLTIATNSLTSKEFNKNMHFLESKIIKFDKNYDFFNEILDLLNIAYINLFNDRQEDALIYFFKIIERIAKEHYLIYMDRYHNKTYTKKNKLELKKLFKRVFK